MSGIGFPTLSYSPYYKREKRNPVSLAVISEEMRQWLLDLPKDEIICLDLETTGLYPHQTDEVLQVSICNGNGEMLLNTYVKPANRKRWPNAQAIHGITPAMVKDAPTLLDISSEIYSLIESCTLLIGYNVRDFDLEFLIAGGVKLPRFLKVYDLINDCSVLYSYWNSSYCNYTYISLEKVANKLGITYSPHDSSEDVQATVNVYYKLLNSEKMKSAVMSAERRRTIGAYEQTATTRYSVKTNHAIAAQNKAMTPPKKTKPKAGCLKKILLAFALLLVIRMFVILIEQFLHLA